MSQQDGFGSGFLAGAIVGSVVGGILGALIARRDSDEVAEEDPQLTPSSVEPKKTAKKRQIKAPEQEAMEMEAARRSLEDKIAQLNATIDEVRQQLGNVNGNSTQQISEPSRSGETR
jgi:gas vesicle protein